MECKRVSEDAILGQVEHEAAANPIMMVEKNGNGCEREKKYLGGTVQAYETQMGKAQNLNTEAIRRELNSF